MPQRQNFYVDIVQCASCYQLAALLQRRTALMMCVRSIWSLIAAGGFGVRLELIKQLPARGIN